MHPCDSTALAKKNRPGRHVWSSTWCFWIVHGHVQTKSGFQLLCEDGRFSQIWSCMVNLFILIMCICLSIQVFHLVIVE